MNPYHELETRFARLGALKEAISVLSWDHQAMMPVGGASARQAQLSNLELVRHELLTHAALPDLLEDAAARNDLDGWERANVAEMRREWRRATAIPGPLLEASVNANLVCEMVWREARPANDFARVKPALQNVLDLAREIATAKAAVLGCSEYDALLDEWEPDGSSAEIDRLFGELEAFLPGAIAAIIERQRSEPPPLRPEGPFSVEAQRAASIRLMAAVGFDFEHGRLDVSAHPFCGGTPDDLRITTRYDESDFSRALMAVLHETGHAMYERGLPERWRRQPVGKARGLSLHESQSLTIEMQACRSRKFLEFAAPILREAFHGSGSAWTADNLYRLYTRVERSPIRVYADEATYPAHVILRYRLERQMLAGDLSLDDLPDAWHEAMRRLVGIEPVDDAEGCLQDIHWYSGVWGYFPTYTLGAMTAAQLFEAACAADLSILPSMASGNFRPLLGWLGEHVHARASSASTGAIVAAATGRPLEVEPFRRHLERRYLGGGSVE